MFRGRVDSHHWRITHPGTSAATICAWAFSVAATTAAARF
jgi:hypothetical protein